MNKVDTRCSFHFQLSPKVVKKERVSSACSNCRKNHTCCDEQRPCQRCIKLGKEASCVDVKSKKRGPKPKSKSDCPSKKQKTSVAASQVSQVTSIEKLFEGEELVTLRKGIEDLYNNSEESVSFLLNYDGIQFDVGLQTSLLNRSMKSQVGFLQLSPEWYITEANEIIFEKFNYGVEIYTLKWFDLIHPAYRDLLKETTEKFIEEIPKTKLEEHSGREVGVSKDGSVFEFIYQANFTVENDKISSVKINLYFE